MFSDREIITYWHPVVSLKDFDTSAIHKHSYTVVIWVTGWVTRSTPAPPMLHNPAEFIYLHVFGIFGLWNAPTHTRQNKTNPHTTTLLWWQQQSAAMYCSPFPGHTIDPDSFVCNFLEPWFKFNVFFVFFNFIFNLTKVKWNLFCPVLFHEKFFTLLWSDAAAVSTNQTGATPWFNNIF